MLRDAKILYDLGFAIHWLKPKSKMPLESGWTTGERKPWDYLRSTYREGMNVGVRTGRASKIGQFYLACIDVDIHDVKFKAAALARLQELVGNRQMPTVVSGGGKGSRHLYCATREPFKMITIEKHPEWEIVIYSEGRQMALPPSLHPDSGRLYRWHYPCSRASDLPVMDFGGQEQARAEKPGNFSSRAGPSSDMAGFKFTLPREEIEVEAINVPEKISQGILIGAGYPDGDKLFKPACEALLYAGVSPQDILSILTDKNNYAGKASLRRRGARIRAAEWVWAYSLGPMIDKKENGALPPPGLEGVEVPPARILTQEEFEDQEEDLINWRDGLVKNADRRGINSKSLKNADLILTNLVDARIFRENLFASRVEYGVDTPWGAKKDEYLRNKDAVLIKRWFASTDLKVEPAATLIDEAITVIADRFQEHPVREYLQGLKWDGVARIDNWLRIYCKAEAAEPYLKEVSRKFLLAMVKRVFEPGCQWDYVLILEGKQGKFKSSVARALASDRWFMDNLPDLRDKDAMLNLQGKWLVELAELHNVKFTDRSAVKGFLTRRIDTVRPHYGKHKEEVPRQSVFIGTVNEGQYLSDPTGDRRYWPVRVHECNVEELKKVRDQLFAEAYYVYKTQDEKLMLSEEATAQAVEAQESKKIDSDRTEMKEALEEFMKTKEGEGAMGPASTNKETKKKTFSFQDFKSSELFSTNMMPWFDFKLIKYRQQTAAEILHSLGFVQKRDTTGNRRFWQFPDAKSSKKLLTTHLKKGVSEGLSENADEKMSEIGFQ